MLAIVLVCLLVGGFAFIQLMSMNAEDMRGDPARSPLWHSIGSAIDSGAMKETMFHLPGWRWSIRPDALADMLQVLPTPKSVVLYGSATRRSKWFGANDIDVLWVVPDGERISRDFAGERYRPAGYDGMETVRSKFWHVAVVPESELESSYSSGTEWGTTVARDGIVVAGASEAGGVRWARTLTLKRLVDKYWHAVPAPLETA